MSDTAYEVEELSRILDERSAIANDLQRALNKSETEVATLQTRLAAAERERDELRDALKKFGRHEYTCVTTNYDHPEELGVKCDCGLGAALNGEKK